MSIATQDRTIAKVPATVTPLEKFVAFRAELNAGLVERSEEIDLILTALLAREHVLLIGPPGLGKTLLTDRVCDWFEPVGGAGDRPFHICMNKFTEPDEVFGPMSLASYKAGSHERITDFMLPEARVAFIDEVFNGSSAIGNTLLTILNERRFRNGKSFMTCPLQLCVGASNHWPGGDTGKELGALFDRFMLRKEVRPISTGSGISRLLWDSLSMTMTHTITQAEIEQAQLEASRMPWDAAAKQAFEDILHACRREGILPGDRRGRKCVAICQAYAWLNDEPTVTTDSLAILQHCLWADPHEQPREVTAIISRIAAPSGMVINSLINEANQLMDGADLKDLTKSAAISKKLKEIVRKLRKTDGEAAEEAMEKVMEMITTVRDASIDAMDE